MTWEYVALSELADPSQKKANEGHRFQNESLFYILLNSQSVPILHTVLWNTTTVPHGVVGEVVAPSEHEVHHLLEVLLRLEEGCWRLSVPGPVVGDVEGHCQGTARRSRCLTAFGTQRAP